MIATVIIVLGQLLFLALVGWSVLALLPRVASGPLLPAAPLVGAALIAVICSTTGLLASAWLGAVVTCLVSLACLAVAARGRRGEPSPSWRTLASLPLGIGLGAGAVGVAALPTVWVGDHRATTGGASLDYFYYAAEAAWLAGHRLAEAPTLEGLPLGQLDSPAYAPMLMSLEAGLRTGQPAILAVFGFLTGMESWSLVTPTGLLWLALVSPTAFAVARFLGLRPVASGVVAFCTASSALTISQSVAGNLDGMLGLSVAILAVGVMGAVAAGRLPIAFGALALAGLVAIYSEYAVVIAPAMLATAVAGGRALWPRLRRLLAMGLLAIALCPWAWWAAGRTMLVDRTGGGAEWGSPFYSEGTVTSVGRVLGLTPMSGVADRPLVVLTVATVAAVGVVLACLLSPARAAFVGLVGAGGLLVAYATVNQFGYLQLRTVQLVGPLVIMLAPIGYGHAWDRWSVRSSAQSSAGSSAGSSRAGRRRAGRSRAPGSLLAAGLACVSVAVWAAANVSAAAEPISREMVHERHADEAYEQMRSWVLEVGPSDVMTLVPDIETAVWAFYALRDVPGPAYPAVGWAYLGGMPQWDGSVDRYAVLGPGAFLLSDREPIRANHRFRLVELSGSTAVATPTELTWGWTAFAGPRGEMIGADGSQLLLASGPEGLGRIRLVIDAASASGQPLAITQDGRTIAEATAEAATTVTLRLGEQTSAVVTIDVGGDGAKGETPIALLDVAR